MKVGDLVKCKEEIRQWSASYTEYREAVGIVIGIYSLDKESFLERINLRALPTPMPKEAEAIVDIRLPDGSIDTYDIESCEVISESPTE